MEKFTPSTTPDPQGDLAFLQENLQKKQDTVVSEISKHIDKVWAEVKEANKQTRIDTIKMMRRSRGEYEPEKKQLIKAFGGSDVFIRSGESKCRAAFSWISDIYRGANDVPFSLEPTAIPDLPDETKLQIKQEIIRQGVAMEQQILEQQAQTGQPFDPNQVTKLMDEWQEVAEKKAFERIQKDAKVRCKKAAEKLRDQNQEGGWDKAFKDFLWYFLRCKEGIIKGPILVKRKRQSWQKTEAGYQLVATETLGTDVYAVSPFNFYPSRGMTTPNDGDLCEVHELTRQSISDLIGTPGYSDSEIQAVLNDIHSGAQKAKWLDIDNETEVAQIEKEKNNPSTVKDTKIQALEFYGSVSGKILKEWLERAGFDTSGIDETQEYQTNAWKIGQRVIKAVINPDNLGRKPYHVTSWAKSPTWIHGEGLLEFTDAIEDILNSIARALQNNIAIASGPMAEIDKDRVDDKTPIYPWMRVYSTSSQMKSGPAVNFYQPQMHVQELIAAYTFFARLLDEMTVPAYAQGASQSGVTAGTATVFTQLLAAASRSIKAVVANIDDDIITPYNQMSYDLLMSEAGNDEMKGDAHVVAKGVAGLQAKEQEAQRKVEFLQVCANPTYAQTLGAKNIGYILAEIAKANNLDLPDGERLEGLPTLEELLTKMNLQAAGVDPMQATGQIGAGGTPANAQATTADGRPAGSPEFQQPAQIGA